MLKAQHQITMNTTDLAGITKMPALTVLSGAILFIAGFLAFPRAYSQGSTGDGVDGSKAAASVGGAAADHSNQFSKPYGYYLLPILDYVHANKDQRDKISAIVQSYRSRIEPLSTEYKQKNQELLNNLSQGGSSEAIMGQQTHLGRLYSEITLYYCQMSLEVRKNLAPDQIVLYEEFKRQRGWAATPSNRPN